MMLRSIAMMTLDSTSTKVKAAPMPKAFETEVVSARVEQVPSTRRRTGFSLMIPLVRMLTLETFSCAIVLFQPPLCELVVAVEDRKSTRLNSSHVSISYAVFCLKKKQTEYE